MKKLAITPNRLVITKEQSSVFIKKPTCFFDLNKQLPRKNTGMKIKKEIIELLSEPSLPHKLKVKEGERQREIAVHKTNMPMNTQAARDSPDLGNCFSRSTSKAKNIILERTSIPTQVCWKIPKIVKVPGKKKNGRRAAAAMRHNRLTFFHVLSV